MKHKFFSRLPGIRWAPSDIPTDEPTPTPKSKPKEKPRYIFTLRASPATPPPPPPNGTASPRHPLRTISVTSQRDALVDARTHAQPQSMFFARLPLELRTLVYEYVMGEAALHLTLGAKQKFGHFVCDTGRAGDKQCGCRVLVGGRAGARLSGACVRVLRVCRRVYSEAIVRLYRPHTFALLHVSHLLHLPIRVPLQRLSTIRTLRLRWAIRALPYLRRGPANRVAYREDTANWEKGWAILAGMAGLRDLYVVLADPSPQQMWERNWLELEEQLLLPIKEVVQPGVFEVVLPYASCGTEWDMGESRVRLCRPEGMVNEEGQ